jgi:hypothetical protein
MGLKEFLMPDLRKIVIFVVLLIILILVFSSAAVPLQFISIVLYPLTLENCAPGSKSCQQTFNWFIIISWLFLYTISCLIVWICDKYIKKR